MLASIHTPGKESEVSYSEDSGPLKKKGLKILRPTFKHESIDECQETSAGSL